MLYRFEKTQLYFTEVKHRRYVGKKHEDDMHFVLLPNGDRVSLTETQAKLLIYLLQRQGEEVKFDEMAIELLGHPYINEKSLSDSFYGVKNAIPNLKAKIRNKKFYLSVNTEIHQRPTNIWRIKSLLPLLSYRSLLRLVRLKDLISRKITTISGLFGLSLLVYALSKLWSQWLPVDIKHLQPIVNSKLNIQRVEVSSQGVLGMATDQWHRSVLFSQPFRKKLPQLLSKQIKTTALTMDSSGYQVFYVAVQDNQCGVYRAKLNRQLADLKPQFLVDCDNLSQSDIAYDELREQVYFTDYDKDSESKVVKRFTLGDSQAQVIKQPSHIQGLFELSDGGNQVAFLTHGLYKSSLLVVFDLFENQRLSSYEANGEITNFDWTADGSLYLIQNQNQIMQWQAKPSWSSGFYNPWLLASSSLHSFVDIGVKDNLLYLTNVGRANHDIYSWQPNGQTQVVKASQANEYGLQCNRRGLCAFTTQSAGFSQVIAFQQDNTNQSKRVAVFDNNQSAIVTDIAIDGTIAIRHEHAIYLQTTGRDMNDRELERLDDIDGSVYKTAFDCGSSNTLYVSGVQADLPYLALFDRQQAELNKLAVSARDFHLDCNERKLYYRTWHSDGDGAIYQASIIGKQSRKVAEVKGELADNAWFAANGLLYWLEMVDGQVILNQLDVKRDQLNQAVLSHNVVAISGDAKGEVVLELKNSQVNSLSRFELDWWTGSVNL